MGLKQIIGFLHEAQDLSATWGVNTIVEQCLIEMDSPLEDIIDVQVALPAYDFGVTSEPTFTIGLSYHPERTDLILKQANGVRVHPMGRPYWIVDLTYETGQWLDKLLNNENQGAGNVGRMKRFDSTPGTGEPATQIIKYPWDEPPTWQSSTRRVRINIFHDINGDPLQHANGLPILEGVSAELDLEVHTFTWNVEYDTFTYSTDIAPFIGRINATTVFGALADHVLLESCTCVENYRTVNLAVPTGQSSTGATATHHFVTLTGTFVIDRRTDSVLGYFREANRRVSMHTLQLVLELGLPIGLAPIDVNERGDRATSPWPLQTDGSAYPYATIDTANPLTDFAFIDTLLPEQNDLAAFATLYGLAIP